MTSSPPNDAKSLLQAKGFWQEMTSHHLVLLCRLRSAETVTASLPLALGLTNKDERWINFNFNSVSRMCKADDDIS